MTTRRNFGVAIVLVFALVLVEHFGLERTAEKREEDKYAKVADLPASSVLPSYVASLFLGSFRAVVIDALWLEVGRMREEEHRHFETVELMNFISVLQPRNPEVWAQQAQDAGWNIANMIDDPERKWQWIKVAYRTLDRGIRQLPDNPYLKNDMARLLSQKPTWRIGQFDTWYLKQVEQDAELQALLQDEYDPASPKTAFELAIGRLRRAKEDILKLKERDGFRYFTTQSGLNLHLSTIDGFIRLNMSYQAHYLWRQGRFREAAHWFREAAAQDRHVFTEHQNRYFADNEAIDRGCAEIVEGLEKSGDRNPAAEMAKVDELMGRSRYGDTDYLWTHAGDLRRALGGDAQEWNDSLQRTTSLRPKLAMDCNLAGGNDTDVFSIFLQAPPEGEAFGRHTIRVGIGNPSAVPLRATLLMQGDADPVEPATYDIPAGRTAELSYAVDRPGEVFVTVVAAAPVSPEQVPAYRIAWVGFD